MYCRRDLKTQCSNHSRKKKKETTQKQAGSAAIPWVRYVRSRCVAWWWWWSPQKTVAFPENLPFSQPLFREEGSVVAEPSPALNCRPLLWSAESRRRRNSRTGETPAGGYWRRACPRAAVIGRCSDCRPVRHVHRARLGSLFSGPP